MQFPFLYNTEELSLPLLNIVLIGWGLFKSGFNHLIDIGDDERAFPVSNPAIDSLTSPGLRLSDPRVSGPPGGGLPPGEQVRASPSQVHHPALELPHQPTPPRTLSTLRDCP